MGSITGLVRARAPARDVSRIPDGGSASRRAPRRCCTHSLEKLPTRGAGRFGQTSSASRPPSISSCSAIRAHERRLRAPLGLPKVLPARARLRARRDGMGASFVHPRARGGDARGRESAVALGDVESWAQHVAFDIEDGSELHLSASLHGGPLRFELRPPNHEGRDVVRLGRGELAPGALHRLRRYPLTCQLHSDCRRHHELGLACMLAGAGWAPDGFPLGALTGAVDVRSRSVTATRSLRRSLSASRTGPIFVELRASVRASYSRSARDVRGAVWDVRAAAWGHGAFARGIAALRALSRSAPTR